MLTGLIHNRIANIKLTTGQCCSFSYFWAFVLHVFDCNVADEFVKDVTLTYVSSLKATQDPDLKNGVRQYLKNRNFLEYLMPILSLPGDARTLKGLLHP